MKKNTPYQRDYLQIIGLLTAVGALLFGLAIAGLSAKRGVLPTDTRSLAAFGVLATLIIGGAGLSRAKLWGGVILAVAYVAVALWYVHLAIAGVHTMPAWRLALTFGTAALMLAPGVLVVRWRRHLR